MFKVIVAGTRTFNDYKLLSEKLDRILQNKTDISIISGCARGADTLGERYAFERGHEIMKFPANWNEHGKAAGFLRNQEMAKVADAVVVFWDGSSKGTAHMIRISEELGLPLRVIKYT